MRGVRRLLRSILAFLGAGILPLLMTAQFAPGWRPAPKAPTLNPQPRGLPASSPLLDVEQQAIDKPSVAGGAGVGPHFQTPGGCRTGAGSRSGPWRRTR